MQRKVHDGTAGVIDAGKKGIKDVAGHKRSKQDPVFPPHRFGLDDAAVITKLVQTCVEPR